MRVPVQDNFKAMPSANTGGRFTGLPTPPDAGALVKETGKSLNEASRLFVYMQGEQNKVIVDDLTNQLIKEANRLQFDPEEGAFTQLGKNAVERSGGKSLNDEYGAKFKKFADDLINSDKDPLRRSVLSQKAAQISAQMDTKITQHVLNQNNIYKNETYQGQIVTAAETAALNWGDNTVIAQSLQQANDAVDRLAEMKGLSPDAKKALRSTLIAPFHAGVIEARIDAGDSRSAQKYYDIIASDLTPQAQNQLRDAIRVGGVKDESMRLFDSLKGSGVNTAKKQLQSMFEKGEITAEVRDATEQRLQANWSFQRAQRSEYEKTLLGQAYEFVRNNPGKTYNDIPVSMQKQLTASGLNRTVDSWFATGGNVKTNSVLWASIMSDPSQLAGMTPLDIQKKWGSQISESDLRTLYSYTEEGRKEKGSSEILTTSEAIKAAAIRMGYLDPKASRNTKEMAENYYQFQEEVQRHIDVYKQENGKAPTQQEIRKIISNIEMNTARTGFFFGGEKPVFSLTESQKREAFVVVDGKQVKLSSIPADVRAGLVSALRRNNIYPSEMEIAKLWVDSGRPTKVKKRK